MVNHHQYLPRLLEVKLEKALKVMRVVVVTGARQTGKTTLARHHGDRTGRRFWTLDSPETREIASRSPGRLWEAEGRVTLDEVQRAPDLLLEIKRAVDGEPAKGRFLLTGSANLLLMKGISESLAGRALYLVLEPLTWGETLAHPPGAAWEALLDSTTIREARERLGAFRVPKRVRLAGAVFRGGLPETLFLEREEDVSLWRTGYVDTYLERDLRQQAQVADLPDFLRLMKLAAARTGCLLNVSELARDAGLAVSTARRWLNILQVCFQIRLLPTYSVSRTKRLIKAAKVYWMDSGMACHLAGISSAREVEACPSYGALVETFALQNLAALAALATPPAELLYWRTASGLEVDFVAEWKGRLLPIEVKAAQRVSERDARGLRAFLSEYPQAARFGLILYDGDQVLPVGDRLLAVPLSLVFAA